MSFAQSGSTITQTGTDVGLGGLVGLSGVTAWESSANGTNARGINLGSNKLVVNGTLTLDPENEFLAQNSAAARPNMEINGRLNIGTVSTVNGVDRYSYGLAIHVGDNGSPWQEASAAIRVNNGGELHWYGGTVSLSSNFAWMENSTIRIYSQNAVLYFRAQASSQPPQIRQRSGNCEVYGLTMMEGNFTVIVPANVFSGILPIHNEKVFSPSGATANNTWITIRDYDASGGNIVDFACWQDKWMRAYNSVQGSNVSFGGHLPNDDFNRGFCAYYADLRVTAEDVDGVGVDTLGIFVKDRRHIGNRLANGVHASNEDFRPDRIYTDATIDGSPCTAEVLIAVSSKAAEGPRFASVIWDYRGEQNNSSDVFIARARSYEYLFQSNSVTLKGVGGVDFNTVMFADTAIHQDEATALAHTGITVERHGTSVAWQGLNWGITVTGDTSVNPGLTADDIFHHLKAHLSRTDVVFHGELGGVWHNLVRQQGSGFVSERGTYGGDRIPLGVRVVDQNGDPFPGFISLQSDTGAAYVPPVQYTVLFQNLQVGSEVRLYRTDNKAELGGIEESTTSFAYNFVYTGDIDFYYVVFHEDYQAIKVTGLTLTASNQTFLIQQVFDRVFLGDWRPPIEILFDSQGGTGVDSIVRSPGSDITIPNGPFLTNYTFQNWNTQVDGLGTSYSPGATYTVPPVDTLTFYAAFAINTYTVTIEDWDGSVIDTQVVEHGANAVAPATDPTRTGHTFIGWLGSFLNVTAPRTITADYEILTYTVTFTDASGVIDTQTVDHGSSAVAPVSVSEPAGQTFTGWDTVFTNVTSDLTVTAQYDIATFTVTTNVTGGSVTPLNPVVNYGDTVIIEGTADTNYTFDSFSGLAGGELLDIGSQFVYTSPPITADVTLTFTFVLPTYTVVFNDWEGNPLSTQFIESGQDAVPPDASRVGFTFNGWDLAYTNIDSDRTLTPQYTAITYSVTFRVSNVVRTSAYSTIVNYGDTWTGTGYTNSGYDFQGDVTAAFSGEAPPVISYSTTPRTGDPVDGGSVNFEVTVGPFTEAYTGNIRVRGTLVREREWVVYGYDGTILTQGTSAVGTPIIAPAIPTHPDGFPFLFWRRTVDYGVEYEALEGELIAYVINDSVGFNSYTAVYDVPVYAVDLVVTNSRPDYTPQSDSVLHGDTTQFDIRPLTTDGGGADWEFDGVVATPLDPSGNTVTTSSAYKRYRYETGPVTSNLSLTAGYTGQTNYTVTYEFEDTQTLISTESVLVGDAATYPSSPVHPDGDDFVAWVDSDFAYHNDRHLAITGNRTFRARYNSTDWRLVQTLDAGTAAYTCAFSPDGTRLAVSASEINNAFTGGSAGFTVFNTSTWALDYTLPSNRQRHVVFSPDGTKVYTALRHGFSSSNISKWDVATQTLDAETSGNVSWLQGISLSPDGSQIVAIGATSTEQVRVYDTATMLLAATQPPNLSHLGEYGEFSPDGTLFAIGCQTNYADNQVLYVFDTTTWTEVSGAPGFELDARFHGGGRKRAAFRPNGDLIFMALATSYVVLNTSTWAVVAERTVDYDTDQSYPNMHWSKSHVFDPLDLTHNTLIYPASAPHFSTFTSHDFVTRFSQFWCIHDINANTYAPRHPEPLQPLYPDGAEPAGESIDITSDGQLLAVQAGNKIYVYERRP